MRIGNMDDLMVEVEKLSDEAETLVDCLVFAIAKSDTSLETMWDGVTYRKVYHALLKAVTQLELCKTYVREEQDA